MTVTMKPLVYITEQDLQRLQRGETLTKKTKEGDQEVIFRLVKTQRPTKDQVMAKAKKLGYGKAKKAETAAASEPQEPTAEFVPEPSKAAGPEQVPYPHGQTDPGAVPDTPPSAELASTAGSGLDAAKFVADSGAPLEEEDDKDPHVIIEEEDGDREGEAGGDTVVV